MTLNLTAAISFLRNQMYNTTDKLARESTKDTGNNYYFNSANGLYHAVMSEADPANAKEQLRQAVNVKQKCGKCSNIIYTGFADTLHPAWRRATRTRFTLKTAPGEETWISLTNGVVRNNNSTGTEQDPSSDKLNVKCQYIIHNMIDYYRTGNVGKLNDAKSVWQVVLGMFDDAQGGYVDSQPAYRETYKQGLVKICGEFPELEAIGPYQEASGMWDGTVQDATTGGIYARYIKSGGVCNNNGQTFENTEATTSIILGYRTSKGYFE